MLTNLARISGRCLVFICTIISGGYADAQISQVARLEIPMKPGETTDNYAVVSAQGDGIVVYNFLTSAKKSFIHVSNVDTTLHEVWNGAIEIDNNYVPNKAVVYRGTFFLLCRHLTRSAFLLITVNLGNKNYSIHNIPNFIPFTPTYFISLGESVMIGGSFNYRPFVLQFSLGTGKSKILPGFYNEQGELLQLRAAENGMVDVIVSAKNADRKKCLWLRNYDSAGTLIKTTIIEPGPDKNLIFGRSVKGSGDEQVIAGVYGRTIYYARGIFLAHINPQGEYDIKYYNFADLQNFFSYMKAGREKRVRNRIERRKIKGKKNRFNYRFLVHELVPYGDQLIMLGEAFFPQYKPATVNGSTVFGYNSFFYRGRNDQIFDGYKYTHAVVIGLSTNGKLLWDNSFEINDVKTFSLEQFVRLQPKENHINLLYLYNNLIRTKIIQGSDVLEGNTTESIKTNFDSDIPVKDVASKNKLEYWYPGVFYAFGSQRITNSREADVALVRNVFYINKITSR